MYRLRSQKIVFATPRHLLFGSLSFPLRCRSLRCRSCIRQIDGLSLDDGTLLGEVSPATQGRNGERYYRMRALKGAGEGGLICHVETYFVSSVTVTMYYQFSRGVAGMATRNGMCATKTAADVDTHVLSIKQANSLNVQIMYSINQSVVFLCMRSVM